MKFRLACAALFSLVLVQPAQAATIVQNSGNQGPYDFGAFFGFDPSLGSLTGVTLSIQAHENRLAWGHIGAWPGEAPDSVPVEWTISGGDAVFGLFGWPDPTAPVEQLASFSIPLSGSGQAVVTEEDRAIEMTADGSASFIINPALIPTLGSGVPGYDFFFDLVGSGYYTHADSHFSPSFPLNTQGLGGECADGFGEQVCNSYGFTLTYRYTPRGAVPEPSTWAMLLLGLGCVGIAMRKQRRLANARSH